LFHDNLAIFLYNKVWKNFLGSENLAYFLTQRSWQIFLDQKILLIFLGSGNLAYFFIRSLLVKKYAYFVILSLFSSFGEN